ncbi:MAG: type II toxin-antitoxin system RelB/DinJ family antitoxin [Clostridia bacterium]|nr:type II toxin-antitoxin system RelB/DinJ family antitoxin [Clostridia bacterium]
MSTNLVQFRTDEKSRDEAIAICSKLGIDLPTYLRMCISRLVSENGIPFSMKVDDLKQDVADGSSRNAGK